MQKDFNGFTMEELGSVIEAQQQTIQSLTNEVVQLKKTTETRPYNHHSTEVARSLGITNEGAIELERAVRHWFMKSESPSFVFEEIEKSSLPIREKIIMAWILGQNMKLKER